MFKILSRRSLLSIYDREPPHWRVLHFVLRRRGKIFRVRGTSPKFLMQREHSRIVAQYDQTTSRVAIPWKQDIRRRNHLPPLQSRPRKETFAMLRSPF